MPDNPGIIYRCSGKLMPSDLLPELNRLYINKFPPPRSAAEGGMVIFCLFGEISHFVRVEVVVKLPLQFLECLYGIFNILQAVCSCRYKP